MQRWSFRSLMLFVVGLVVGITAGMYLGHRVGVARSWMGAMSVSMAVSQRAELLYSEGNYDAAREGLETYLEFLDGVEAHRGDASEPFWLTGRGLPFERMLTLGRLAFVEERRPDSTPGRADDLWGRAQVAASAAGIKDTSRSSIRSVVERAQTWFSGRQPPTTK